MSGAGASPGHTRMYTDVIRFAGRLRENGLIFRLQENVSQEYAYAVCEKEWRKGVCCSEGES